MNNKYVLTILLSISSLGLHTGYIAVNSAGDFDEIAKQKKYTVVAFYNDAQKSPEEIEQFNQFRSIFNQLSASPKYAQKNVQFVAVNVAPGTGGATIKMRYDVVGYPSYIILHNGKQTSPGGYFSFFKVGNSYLSDDVTQQELEEFIDATIK